MEGTYLDGRRTAIVCDSRMEQVFPYERVIDGPKGYLRIKYDARHSMT